MMRPRPWLLFVLWSVAFSGCASPQVKIQDTIKPPLSLGPVHRIGVIVWPVDTQEQRLFLGTLLRNLQGVQGLHPVGIPFTGPTDHLPMTIPELAHFSKANDLIFVNILSHTTSDRRVVAGNCPAPPCHNMNVPMTMRTNSMRLHIIFLRAFPFHVDLDRTVEVHNTSRKVSFSLFQRHFTPPTTLNLHLYAKISQHIRYLFTPLSFTVKRPFYPYNTLTEKAYRSLQTGKPVLALFFLISEFERLLQAKKTIPHRLYADFGVTYESLNTYSLASYYYRKASHGRKSGLFERFEHQMQSVMVYFIGINFFEKGS